jgi:hypothetical protein
MCICCLTITVWTGSSVELEWLSECTKNPLFLNSNQHLCACRKSKQTTNFPFVSIPHVVMKVSQRLELIVALLCACEMMYTH